MFFSTTLVERRRRSTSSICTSRRIPFHSLANNVVPAVVLFSVIVGIALIGVERKQLLLDVLQTRRRGRRARDPLDHPTDALRPVRDRGDRRRHAEPRATRAAAGVSRHLRGRGPAAEPLGPAGPGRGADAHPVRDIFALTRDALITAFVAGDLFIVLPVLIEASRTLIAAARAATDRTRPTLPDVHRPRVVQLSAHGQLLSISFVLFAGWFADAAVRVADYPRLAFTGLVTFFGSLNVAVPFLLDLFRIPADTFQLFLASGVINSRFGTLRGGDAHAGRGLAWHLRGRRDCSSGTGAGSCGIWSITARADDRRHRRDSRALCASLRDTATRRTKCSPGCSCCARRASPPSCTRPRRQAATAPEGQGLLEAIRARGALRVGSCVRLAAVRILQCAGRPGRIRRRAGISTGSRAGRSPRVHSRCSASDSTRTSIAASAIS